MFTQLSTAKTMNAIQTFALAAMNGKKKLEDVTKEEFMKELAKSYLGNVDNLDETVEEIESEFGDRLPKHISDSVTRFQANVCRVNLNELAEVLKKNNILVLEKGGKTSLVDVTKISGTEVREDEDGNEVPTINGKYLIEGLKFKSSDGSAIKIDDLILYASLNGQAVYPEWEQLAELFGSVGTGRGRKAAVVGESAINAFAL